MDNIQERVIAVIAREQSLEPTTITMDSTFEALQIDSVSAIGIAFDIETEFDIDFSDDEMFGLKCVRDIVDGVSKLVKQ
ncbi:MAG: phosphopantetheine-binding protein [Mariprofundus sp.]|nr:phosphopantetheine-binding protein [Mariprofundus sp.]